MSEYRPGTEPLFRCSRDSSHKGFRANIKLEGIVHVDAWGEIQNLENALGDELQIIEMKTFQCIDCDAI